MGNDRDPRQLLPPTTQTRHSGHQLVGTGSGASCCPSPLSVQLHDTQRNDRSQDCIMRDASRSSILTLPDEILYDILVAAGPASAASTSATCHRLRDAFNSAAVWKRFLEAFAYPDHHEVAADSARSVALEHYCRSCDTIVPRMFYTGNICITCEYSQIKNESQHYHCLGRIHRVRINRLRKARLEAV